MSYGDGSFSRGNCDWPDDPRCIALNDNDSRWVDEVLWRLAVKQRDPVIPARFDEKVLAARCCVTPKKLRACIVDIARQNLIRFTRDGLIVVVGVVKNHPKLHMKPEPDDTINPYYGSQVVGWLDDTDTPPIPHRYPTDTGALPVHRREEKRREEKSDSLEPDEPASKPTASSNGSAQEREYMTFPTVGEPKTWTLTSSTLNTLHRGFPDVDLLAECRKALAWCKTHPKQLKTARGMGKFLYAWMARGMENNTAVMRNGAAKPGRPQDSRERLRRKDQERFDEIQREAQREAARLRNGRGTDGEVVGDVLARLGAGGAEE